MPIFMTEPRWRAKAKANGRCEHPNERLESYLDVVRAVARELRTPLVDHYVHWLASELQGRDLGDLTTHQCHPNPPGHVQFPEFALWTVQSALRWTPT
jgi:acyl-CoA thioesterase I